MSRYLTSGVSIIALLMFGHAVHGGGVVQADVFIQDGVAPPSWPLNDVTQTQAPFTNGRGELGNLVVLDNSGGSDRSVWFDTDVIFRSSNVVSPALSGGEGTMGISDTGGFVFSPAVAGEDAVWTHNGLLAIENVQAPGFPVGTVSTFHSRPRMTAGGAAYWVSGFNETGGASTQGRMLYRSSDATPGGISVVLRSDDLILGFPIDRPSGVEFDFDVSDNDAHVMTTLTLDTGSSSDDNVLAVDGVVVAREGLPTGSGDNWDNFDVVGVNDFGHYMFSGDTDALTTTDEIIAFNGAIVVREGDTVDGVTLAGSSASVQAGSLNNRNQIAHFWSTGGIEYLFVGDGATLSTSSVLLLQTGDTISVDGDAVADYTVTDFNASQSIGPGLDFDDDGKIFIEVDIEPIGGGTQLEAVIRLVAPDPACLSDINLDGTVNVSDLLDMLIAWGANPGHVADLNHDGSVNVLDLLILLSEWGPC